MITPTQRELILIAGCARGRSNAELGEAVHAGASTVCTWIRRLCIRAGVRNSAELVALGYQAGWLAGLKPESRDPVVLRGACERVLQGLAEGLSSEEIGRRHYISTNTAKTHARRIYRTLGITGTPRAAARAVALGYQQGILRTNRARAAA